MGLVFNPFTGTFDFTGSGGGGGTIGGSIAVNQVAFGSGANTIQGSANFTYNDTVGLALTGPVGASAFTLSGNTQTASFPYLSATQTWNNAAGQFVGLLAVITATANNSNSYLFDFRVAGAMPSASILRLSPVGDLEWSGDPGSVGLYAVRIAPGSIDFSDGARFQGVSFQGYLDSDQWNVRDYAFSKTASFATDADHVFGHRKGTNAQIVNIYNTYTDATTFERLMLDWRTTANVAQIYTQKGSGGGTARVLQLNYGGTTTAAISIPITSGAMTFGADPTISGFGAITYTTGSVALTGQTADIADTAITINGTGLYSLTYYLLTTTADAAAGTVKLAIKYTDNSGAKEIDSSAVILTATTGFDAGGPITVRTNSGTVTYGTTHTGIYGTSAYALYISLEKLQ